MTHRIASHRQRSRWPYERWFKGEVMIALNVRFSRISLAVTGALCSAVVWAQVPEIPNYSLQDIAMASWYSGALPQFGIPMYNGPVIIYNPNVTAQVGPVLTAFFYAHEYCHIDLNHIQKTYFLSNPYNKSWLSQTLELQADACATQRLISQGNILSVRAAAQWFYGQGPVQMVPSHPPGQVRASNIVNVASSLGVTF